MILRINAFENSALLLVRVFLGCSGGLGGGVGGLLISVRKSAELKGEQSSQLPAVL